MRTKTNGFVRGHAATDPSPDVPDGSHRAELLRVYPFTNAYGERVMFEFLLTDGNLVSHSAAPSRSPHGKLAESLHGLLGREPTEAELAAPNSLAGRSCTVVVRTVSNRSGKRYPSVIAITP